MRCPDGRTHRLRQFLSQWEFSQQMLPVGCFHRPRTGRAGLQCQPPDMPEVGVDETVTAADL